MAVIDPTKELRIIREPTVHLVGRQVVDEVQVDQFLADHGVSWETDTEVAGEHLTEIAGRVCYMSFAKPRPGGNKVYLDHIKEAGHGSLLERAVSPPMRGRCGISLKCAKGGMRKPKFVNWLWRSYE